MNDPRIITDAEEIQALIETRFPVHFSEQELLFELERGGLLSVRARSNYLYAVLYPPGWRDGVEVANPEADTAPTAVQEQENEDKARVVWLLVMLAAAATAALAYWMSMKGVI